MFRRQISYREAGIYVLLIKNENDVILFVDFLTPPSLRATSPYILQRKTQGRRFEMYLFCIL